MTADEANNLVIQGRSSAILWIGHIAWIVPGLEIAAFAYVLSLPRSGEHAFILNGQLAFVSSIASGILEILCVIAMVRNSSTPLTLLGMILNLVPVFFWLV